MEDRNGYRRVSSLSPFLEKRGPTSGIKTAYRLPGSPCPVPKDSHSSLLTIRGTRSVPTSHIRRFGHRIWTDSRTCLGRSQGVLSREILPLSGSHSLFGPRVLHQIHGPFPNSGLSTRDRHLSPPSHPLGRWLHQLTHQSSLLPILSSSWGLRWEVGLLRRGRGNLSDPTEDIGRT